jgi:hypothetical protein
MNDDQLSKDVSVLNKAVFGDRENPKESPGILSELAQMNKTLSELSGSVRWIVRLILSTVLMAVLAVVLKLP